MMLTSLVRARSSMPSVMTSWKTRSTPSMSSTLRRNLSALPSPVDDNDSEVYSPEVLPTEGEWAGCSRRFMAPLRISTRGAGTRYGGIIAVKP
jgi:hypothetical protein